MLNSTKAQTCSEMGEQSCSKTWEGWAGERLSLKLRNPVFPTDLTHSFKPGSKKLEVSFIRVCSLSRWWANIAAKQKCQHPATKRSWNSAVNNSTGMLQHSSFTGIPPPPPLPPTQVRFHLWCANREPKNQIAALTKSRTRQRRWWTARAHTEPPRTKWNVLFLTLWRGKPMGNVHLYQSVESLQRLGRVPQPTVIYTFSSKSFLSHI